jgi:hypothetical protein
MGDSNCPPGWTYNPSSWSEWLWIAGAESVGLLVSGYLALYHLLKSSLLGVGVYRY